MELRRNTVHLLVRSPFQSAALARDIDRSPRFRCNVVTDLPYTVKPDADLLLIDLYQTGMARAFHWLELIRERSERPAVALLNVENAQFLENLLHFPFIRGLFFVGTPYQQLLRGIEGIIDGDIWVPQRLLFTYLEQTCHHAQSAGGVPKLTNKEVEVLELLAAGHSNHAMADRLHVSIHTVKTHIYNLFRKLDVSNRTQATNWVNDHRGSLQRLHYGMGGAGELRQAVN